MKLDAPRRPYFHHCHDVIVINDFAWPQLQSALGLSWQFLENTVITWRTCFIMCLPSKNCRSQLFLSFISIAFHWAQKHIEQSWPVNEDKHAISEVYIFFYFSLWLLYDYKYVDFEENDKYPLDIRSTGLSGVRAHLEIDTNCVWTSSLGYISFPDKPSEIIKDILSKFIQVITSNRYWK